MALLGATLKVLTSPASRRPSPLAKAPKISCFASWIEPRVRSTAWHFKQCALERGHKTGGCIVKRNKLHLLRVFCVWVTKIEDNLSGMLKTVNCWWFECFCKPAMYVPTTDQKFIVFVEIHDVSLKFQVFRTKQHVYKFRWLKTILSCSALTLLLLFNWDNWHDYN